jgi:hypothetical protein
VNVDGLAWRTSWTVQDQGAAEQVLALERQQPDGSFMEVPFRWSYNAWPDWPTIAPEGGFEQGVTYRVSNREFGVREACGAQTEPGGPGYVDVELVDQTFEVIAPVTSLGLEVEVSEAARGDVSFDSSSCSELVDAISRTVRVEVPQEFDRAVALELHVDGRSFYHSPSTCVFREPGALGQSRHEAIVPVACEEWPDGLGEGAHTIQVKGRLWGSDVRFESEPQTLDWSCEPPAEPDTPGGSHSGCSQSGGAPLGGVVVFGALGLVGLAYRTRRSLKREEAS